MMRTIYLSTLNRADKEFFLTFLYIANVEQAWQNPSNINLRVELRALISSTRSNIDPWVGFELLSETQVYGQAIRDQCEFDFVLRTCDCDVDVLNQLKMIRLRNLSKINVVFLTFNDCVVEL
jgi:hypothetical protein